MSDLERRLEEELALQRARGLERDLNEPGPLGSIDRSGDFTSNDYLGFATHPELVRAASAALERHGTGGRASRLLGGGAPWCNSAEEAVARWLGCESALLFPSGYQANLGLVTTLASRGDVLFSDELNHASLIDAARLSRADVRVFRHGDMEHLAAALARAGGARRRFVLSEGVFSMDGDRAPLAEIAALCEAHDAYLIVDEAHSAGLIGERARGAWALALAEGAQPDRLAARVITGGKALGVGAAFVAGSRSLTRSLVNHARSFVYTTAVPPAVAAALEAAVGLLADSTRETSRACALAQRIARELDLEAPAAAIVPFVVGSSEAALELAARLRSAELDVRAVRPPTVPEGGARLRIACHEHNTDEAVERLIEALSGAKSRPRTRAARRSRARVLCVVGTDTGVGKTVVSSLLLRAAQAAGAPALRYWKPVQTGDDDDTRTVGALCSDLDVSFENPQHRFALPASPDQAAQHEGSAVDYPGLLARFSELCADPAPGLCVVELAGGLLVPYDAEHDQAGLLARVAADVVLVARSGLGTLNHTALTLEAMRRRGLAPRAVILVGPPHPGNHDSLTRWCGLDGILHELPTLDSLTPAALDERLVDMSLAPLVQDTQA